MKGGADIFTEGMDFYAFSRFLKLSGFNFSWDFFIVQPLNPMSVTGHRPERSFWGERREAASFYRQGLDKLLPAATSCY